MKKKPLRILLVIFFLSLLFNLYLSFSSPYLNNDESYFNLRVIDNIKSTGLPIFYDQLSYGGRNLIVQPLFYYIFALLSFIPFYYIIFPALLVSSVIFISYFIAKEITSDEASSLFTALLAGFVPLYSKTLINQFSVYTLILPLIAFMVLCFIKLDNKKYFRWFIVGSIALPFIHSSSFLFIFILLFHLLLMNAENIKLTKLKKEALIFSFFFIFLINIMFFKQAFLRYGFDVVYGNNPLIYNFNIFQGLYLLGIIPLFLGILGLYQGFFKLKRESMVLISSLTLGVLFLLLFNLININLGLLFLSFGLVIASSLALRNFFIYLNKTKISHLKNLIIIVFILLFVFLSLIPTYTGYNKEFSDLSEIGWLRDNAEQDSVILAPLEYGHLITYFAGKQNMIDSNFLLAPDTQQRFYDVNLIYGGWSYNKAIELLKEYDVDYIYITEEVKNIYNIEDLEYLQDEECIRGVKEGIYQFIC